MSPAKFGFLTLLLISDPLIAAPERKQGQVKSNVLPVLASQQEYFKRHRSRILRSRQKKDEDLDSFEDEFDAIVIEERNAQQLYKASIYSFSKAPGPVEIVKRGVMGDGMLLPIGAIETVTSYNDKPATERGTGFLVSPCLVATAGHILADKHNSFTNKFGEMASSQARFSIGWSGKAPFSRQSPMNVVKGNPGADITWNRFSDYALGKLKSCMGVQYGWLQVADFNHVTLDQEYDAMKIGYPANEPLGRLMKQRCSAIIVLLNRGHLREAGVVDNCKGAKEMSGGPVMILQNGEWKVVGISLGDNPNVNKYGRTIKFDGNNALDAVISSQMIEFYIEGDARPNPLSQIIREGRYVAPGYEKSDN